MTVPVEGFEGCEGPEVVALCLSRDGRRARRVKCRASRADHAVVGGAHAMVVDRTSCGVDIVPSRPRRGLSVPLRAAGMVLVCLAVLAAIGVSLRGEASKSLVVVVDGDPVVVSDAYGDVSDVLAAQHIQIRRGDVVSPVATTEIDGLEQITVDRLRSVAVTIDGKSTTVSTTSSSVAGLLAALAIPADASTSLDAAAPLALVGAALTIRTPQRVTVRADGNAETMTTTAATVAELFAAAGIPISNADRLSSPPSTQVVSGATYTLTHVEITVDVARKLLPAKTRWIRGGGIAAGMSRVITTGSDGYVQKRTTVHYEDGRVVLRRTQTTRIVRPVTWVIAVGKSVASATHSWAPASGKVVGRAPNFAALAKCESGGRPRAVNRSGKYRGLFQFDLTTWHGVGGLGDPIDAAPAEQTYRASLLYDDRGRAPWPYCGRFL